MVGKLSLKGHIVHGLWVLWCVLKWQVTLEQHRFEVWGSPYMQIFFSSKYCSITLSICWIYGWIHGYRGTAYTEDWLQVDRFSTARRVSTLTPTLFRNQLYLALLLNWIHKNYINKWCDYVTIQLHSQWQPLACSLSSPGLNQRMAM